VLQFFPFLAYLAVVTAITLLVVLWRSGELDARHARILAGWLLLAAYLQFLGRSMMIAAVGLTLQTMLALYLILYWKLRT
jgi:hypothetical protein